MARNSEKAQSMLFRFRESQAASLGISSLSTLKRPRAITTIDSIPTCERWRGQVLSEISRKVSKIQDPSLSDYIIRDLNDEINKLMKEKFVWEVQIRNLGGPNYMRGGGGGGGDGGGVGIGGGGRGGYKYFGRAKDLPGVKELFEEEERARKGRREEKDGGKEVKILRMAVDAGYYGYNLDEEDGTLLTYEGAKEEEAVEALKSQKNAGVTPDGWEPLPGDAGDGVPWNIPTLDEVQEELMERRRRKLLDKLG